MQPDPRRQTEQESYPTRKEYALHRRAFLQTLGGVALGAGFCALSRIDAGETVPQAPPAKLKKRVAALFLKLGHEDFKIRREATKELIRIGKGTGADKNADNAAKQIVMNAATASCKSKDPEIAQRSKQVITALTPKPKVPPSVPVAKGRIRLRGF